MTARKESPRTARTWPTRCVSRLRAPSRASQLTHAHERARAAGTRSHSTLLPPAGRAQPGRALPRLPRPRSTPVAATRRRRAPSPPLLPPSPPPSMEGHDDARRRRGRRPVRCSVGRRRVAQRPCRTRCPPARTCGGKGGPQTRSSEPAQWAGLRGPRAEPSRLEAAATPTEVTRSSVAMVVRTAAHPHRRARTM